MSDPILVAKKKKLLVWVLALVWMVFMAVLVVGYIIHEEEQDTEARIVSRYTLCKEQESIKKVLRRRTTERIAENTDFLRKNPEGVTGTPITRETIERVIRLDRRDLKALQPRPGGCVTFARDPAGRDIDVPPLPEP